MELEIEGQPTVEMQTTKVLITITNDNVKPYFFIKYASYDKRYRISTSFKYLNTKYGLHINIIRNFERFKLEELQGDSIEFLLLLLDKQEYNIITNDLKYTSYKDINEETEIFFIERKWDNYTNKVIVFFSLKHWSLNEYLKTFNPLKEDTCQHQ
jgi:hypothetical protein